MFISRHSRIRRLVLAVVLALAVPALLSCHSAEQTAAEQALVDTVRQYNSQLQLAYLEVNLNHMAPVATKDQIARLFPTFQALRFEDDYMRAEQVAFKVERVSLKGKDKGQVDTTETWVYWWQDHQTNEITKPRQEAKYHIRYDLVVDDGVWKVDNLEDLDEKK
jgi:hypothetical protein